MRLTRGVLALFALTVGSGFSASPSPAAGPSPEPWQEDARFLAQELKRIHPSPFEGVSASEFDARVDELVASIPSLSDPQRVVGLMKLVALVKDTHTVMSASSGAEREQGTRKFFPVRLERFRGGMYVGAVPASRRELLGAKVVRYGRLPIEEAIERATRVLNHENEWGVEKRLTMILMVPVVLNGLGITRSMDELEIQVVDRRGLEQRVEFEPVDGTSRDTNWYSQGHGLPVAGGITLREIATGPRPLSLRDESTVRGERKTYWFAYDEPSGTLYHQFNRVRDDPAEPLGSFWKRLWAAYDENGARRLVVDLRNNSGGNNQILKPFIHEIIKRDFLARPGRLFVLIGNQTHSAAVSLAAWLETEGGAIFAGEPTAQRPNFYSDPRKVVLPNSRMSIEVSRYFWQNTVPWDDRAAILPDVVAETAIEDVLANRDPLLERVLSLATWEPIDATVRDALASGGEASARAAYLRHKREFPDAWKTTEAAMNEFGYALLQEGRHADAILVFTLNSESYPRSANTWDSLAEAYLTSGDGPNALRAYRKALALEPDDERIQRQVRDLSDGGS